MPILWNNRTKPSTNWGSRKDKGFLLKEDGGYLLLENGGKFILESSYDIDTIWSPRLIIT